MQCTAEVQVALVSFAASRLARCTNTVLS